MDMEAAHRFALQGNYVIYMHTTMCGFGVDQFYNLGFSP